MQNSWCRFLFRFSVLCGREQTFAEQQTDDGGFVLAWMIGSFGACGTIVGAPGMQIVVYTERGL